MISFIILGYRQREKDYATPLVKSVRGYEPDTEIILVDCNSDPHYKKSDNYKLVRVPEPFNASRCLNLGIAASKGDWLMLSNDDVACQGKFADRVTRLDRGTLYGIDLAPKAIRHMGFQKKVLTVYGWMMILHADLFDQLGDFDEDKAGDVEYSIRAIEAGVPVKSVVLPFRHLHHHRRG